MHPARAERARLCDLFEELGPDAPTLCEGWATKDLLAHLVTRERRPDAGPGLLGRGPFAGYTARLESRTAEQDHARLVRTLRAGPPPWWFGRWMPAADLHEFFVHHEDVRRANGLEPRQDAELDAAIWEALGTWARILTRRATVGVELETHSGERRTAKDGDAPVTLRGRPTELMLELFGRDADVEVAGDVASVEAFRSSSIGL